MAPPTGSLISSLTSFLPFGDKSYLTVDIGSSSVKVLEVKGKGRSLRILKAGIFPLDENVVRGNVVENPLSVANAIRSIVEDHEIKATNVITAVPGPSVIIKRANFPAQDQKELQETILFEAGNFIPESLENVNLDYQVLDSDPDTGNVDVLLVAVRKDVINSYITAINEANLTPVVADVDYFALENMFELNYGPEPDEIVALINIGAHYSLINVMKGGRSAFTGDVPVGGQQFTDTLARDLGLGSDQAEDAKVTGFVTGYNQEDIDRVVSVASEQLLEEIQHALSFFGSGATEEQISTIYLSGGTAQLSGLAANMSQRLHIPVEIIDPFRRISISSQDGEFIHQNASSFAVSVGLATRRPGDR
ncbi:MAG: type IV pilus assembly protein PilM [Candidatus Binatia bacterium]